MATEIFRTEVSIDCQGQNATIVNHWKCVDPVETNDFVLARGLVDALMAGVAPIGFINRLVLLMSSDVFVSTVSAIRIHPTGGNTFRHVYQRGDEPGGDPAPWHTGQLAGVAIWISSSRSDVTGRNFIPGVPEGLVVGGRFDAAYASAMDDFITTVIAGFTTPSTVFFPVIWDRVDEVSYQIDDGYLSPKPGTQRRREKPL